MPRSRFAGAGWSANVVNDLVEGGPYGVVANGTISGGVMSFNISSTSANYWYPALGLAEWVVENGKILMFESAGWKVTDTGSGNETVLHSWKVGTLSGAQFWLFLTILWVDATNFKLQLRSGTVEGDGVTGTIRATSSVLRLWDTFYLMDVIIDDSAHTFTVRMGTATVSTDFTYDYTALRDANTADNLIHLRVSGWKSISAAGAISMKACGQWQAETLAEEANTVAEEFEFSKLLLTAADAGHDQGMTGTTPAQTDANKDQNVDECEDGSTAPDNNTSYVNDAGTGSTAFIQGFKTDYIDLTNPAAVCVHNKVRGNVAAKNTDFYAMICDGSVHAFGAVVVAPDASTWKWACGSFVASPSGGTLDDAAFATLQIGVKHVVSVQADIGVLTVCQAEAFGMTPQVVAGGGQPMMHRRRQGSDWPAPGVRAIGRGR